MSLRVLRTTLPKTLATSVILAPRGTKAEQIVNSTRNRIIEGQPTHRETTMTKIATIATILVQPLNLGDEISRPLTRGNATH